MGKWLLRGDLSWSFRCVLWKCILIGLVIKKAFTFKTFRKVLVFIG